MSAAVLSSPTSQQARRLRSFFHEIGYDEAGLRRSLGSAEPPIPQLRNLPRFLDRTRDANSFNQVVRWFLLSQPIDVDAAAPVAPDWFLETCLELGLLRIEDGAYRPNVLIYPYERMLVASDCYTAPGAATPYDHVLTINSSARHTLNFTVRRPSRGTLDLGTGCGIQALVAAGHSEAVVATDLNARATSFAEFNARLNGLDNIQCLTGDLFDPVEGLRFDQIVSCPPFVLTPSREFLYRDNDMALDGFCRRLAREAPRHLNDDGYFQMTAEWVSLEGQTWQERIGEWFEDCPGDVWVIKQYSRSPADYAQTRVRESFQVSPERDAETFSEWMDYYRREKVEAMHGGLVTVRRRPGKQWLVMEQLDQAIDGPVGDAIEQRFAVRDLLEAQDNERRLLGMRPRLLPEVRLEKDSEPVDGQWRELATRLRLSTGLRASIGAQPEVAEFLVRLDGKRSLGELINELAAGLDVDPERVKTECIGVVRLMLERGFLRPE